MERLNSILERLKQLKLRISNKIGIFKNVHFPDKKVLRKKIKRFFRLKNIANILIAIATIALLLSSIMPYLY